MRANGCAGGRAAPPASRDPTARFQGSMQAFIVAYTHSLVTPHIPMERNAKMYG